MIHSVPTMSFHILPLFCVVLTCLTSSTWSLDTRMNNFQRRNFKTVSDIYNLTIYPNQLPILARGGAAVPPGLFSANSVGRVDPVGNFTGFEDSIEYFFALAPVPQPPGYQAISSIKITEFSSGCADVAASVVYLSTSVVNPGGANNGQPLPTLKQIAFWKFDRDGAVVAYDAWITNLNAWVEASTGVSVSNPQRDAATIQQVCGGAQTLCTGANQQWATIAECVADLSQRMFGNYDEAWGDNVVCRSIHLLLAQVRPAVHCPHVGPTGGGKCVNYPYGLEYFNDPALYGDALGETFKCP